MKLNDLIYENLEKKLKERNTIQEFDLNTLSAMFGSAVNTLAPALRTAGGMARTIGSTIKDVAVGVAPYVKSGVNALGSGMRALSGVAISLSTLSFTLNNMMNQYRMFKAMTANMEKELDDIVEKNPNKKIRDDVEKDKERIENNIKKMETHEETLNKIKEEIEQVNNDYKDNKITKEEFETKTQQLKKKLQSVADVMANDKKVIEDLSKELETKYKTESENTELLDLLDKNQTLILDSIENLDDKDIRKRVTVIILGDDNKSILVSTNPYADEPDKIIMIPGGTVDDGETTEETAVREAMEETSAIIKKVNVLNEYIFTPKQDDNEPVCNYYAIAKFSNFTKKVSPDYDAIFLPIPTVIKLLKKKLGKIRNKEWVKNTTKYEIAILKKMWDIIETYNRDITKNDKMFRKKEDKFKITNAFIYQYPINVKYKESIENYEQVIDEIIENIKKNFSKVLDIIYNDMKELYKEKINFDREDLLSYLIPTELIINKPKRIILKFKVDGISSLDNKDLFLEIVDDVSKKIYVA